jgi:hypothetical protein
MAAVFAAEGTTPREIAGSILSGAMTHDLVNLQGSFETDPNDEFFLDTAAFVGVIEYMAESLVGNPAFDRHVWDAFGAFAYHRNGAKALVESAAFRSALLDRLHQELALARATDGPVDRLKGASRLASYIVSAVPLSAGKVLSDKRLVAAAIDDAVDDRKWANTTRVTIFGCWGDNGLLEEARREGSESLAKLVDLLPSRIVSGSSSNDPEESLWAKLGAVLARSGALTGAEMAAVGEAVLETVEDSATDDGVDWCWLECAPVLATICSVAVEERPDPGSWVARALSYIRDTTFAEKGPEAGSWYSDALGQAVLLGSRRPSTSSSRRCAPVSTVRRLPRSAANCWFATA